MDLNKLSDSDLIALDSGRLEDMSDEGLLLLDSPTSKLSELEKIEPSAPLTKTEDPTILDKLEAGARAGLNVIPGMFTGMFMSPVSGLTEKLLNPESDLEKNTAKWAEKYTSPPASKLEEKYRGKIAQALDPLNALVPGAFGIPSQVGRPLPKFAKVDPVQERLNTLQQEKQAPQQPVVDGLPELKEAPPVIPEQIMEHQRGDLGPQPMEPFPVLPDQLKPLSEQVGPETPIGQIEGGVLSDNTPLPEIPRAYDTKVLEDGSIQRATRIQKVGDQYIPENPHETTLSIQDGLPAVVPDTQRLATRHDIPDATVEFPLRQEVLQRPEFQALVDKGINKEITPEAFAAELKQLGIDVPQDAIGLKPLYESGKETKLPVETTKTLGGTGKKGFGQGGAFTPFSKRNPTFEEFKQKYEGYDEDVLRQVYDEQYPKNSLAIAGVAAWAAVRAAAESAVQREKTISKLPGVADIRTKYGSYDPADIDGVIAKMEDVGSVDLPEKVSWSRKNILPAGRLQAWSLPDNGVVHSGIGYITSVKDAARIKTGNALDAINRSFGYFENIGKNWRDANDVVRARRDNEFNSAYKPESQFSGKQLELFNTIHNLFENTWADVETRLKEIKPNLQVNKLPYYFTSFFRGDWEIPLYNEKGQYVFAFRETNKANALKAAQWARDAGFKVDDTKIRLRKTTQWADTRLDQTADFNALLDLITDDKPEVKQALDRMINATQGNSFRTSQMPNRFKEKAGKVGSMGDRPWRTEKENYYDSKEAIRQYVAGANEWLANTQITKFTEQMNRSEKITAKNAKEFISDYADLVTGKKDMLIRVNREVYNATLERISSIPLVGKYIGDISQQKAFARKVAAFNTALYVGWGSARMVVQNTVQPYVASWPKMAELMLIDKVNGNPIKATALGTVEGIFDAIQQLFNGKFGLSETAKFKRDNHITDVHLAADNHFFKNKIADDIYDTAANKSVSASEMLSRSIAFNIYKDFFESAGYSKIDAREMSKNLTHVTMTEYENYAKSPLFSRTGTIGELAGRLQTYKMNQIGQLVGYVSKMKADNPKTWAPLGIASVMFLATAGAVGFIGMNEAELVLDLIKAADRITGDPTPVLQEFSIKKYLYDSLPTEMSLGVLSTSTGMNLSGAFTQNIVGENPATSVFPVYSNIFEQALAPVRIMSDNELTQARGWQAISPSSGKQLIEKKLQSAVNPKTGKTVIASPRTGKPIYSGEGLGYIGGTNIQTLERGKQSLENRLHLNYSRDIEQSKKAIEDKADKFAFNIYKQYNNGTLSESEIAAKVGEYEQQYLEAGGDPTTIRNSIIKSLENLGIGDPIFAELQNTPTVGKRKQLLDAFKIKERRDATNSR